MPTTREDLDVLWARLLSSLDRVERPPLRRLVEETLAVHGSALREHPAAKSIHHACRGGLLEHVVSMLEVGVALCEHYRELDRDLVLPGHGDPFRDGARRAATVERTKRRRRSRDG